MKRRFIRRGGSFGLIAFLMVSLAFAITGWIVIDSDGAFGARLDEISNPSFIKASKSKKIINISFIDEQKKKHHLSDYRNKVVLVYLWGTWCGQCVHDLQSLDAIQRDIGKDKLAILPLSLDQGDLSFLRKYYNQHVIESLPILQDVYGRSLIDLNDIKGLPTVILVDQQGYEIGRFKSDVNQSVALINAKIKKLLKSPAQ